MRDNEEVFEVQTYWGSQGQPVFPSNKDLITEGFKYYLNYVAYGSEEAGRIGGLLAKERYLSKIQPMWYHLF